MNNRAMTGTMTETTESMREKGIAKPTSREQDFLNKQISVPQMANHKNVGKTDYGKRQERWSNKTPGPEGPPSLLKRAGVRCGIPYPL